ncbi:GntR family transcriptional regulator [Cohnella zeiphila]|uniref:GntR family transcriptional regulator n=1 Tax=Cohnella zeiphila TaxID=2761120 RepID=A0A7X0VW29_9BACL|nr:GntR family transcriptional regulator [Cohnella zeiphila]MBB6732070.1 GntR family transcriptional regulator [Cohnella zeiphila]
MHIVIVNQSGKPIYEQIKSQIKEMILTGELKEGESLPSIRQLAKDLRISVITTSRAYSELEQEGFIATMQGKGCFVMTQNSEMMREQYLRRVEEHLSEAVRDARLAGIDNDTLQQMLTLLFQEGDKDA